MKNLEKLRMYIRAVLYCYMDHGEDYLNWKHSKYDTVFDIFFSTLIKDPLIVRCAQEPNIFFMVLETEKEVMVVFPGTRKSIQGLKDFNLDFQMQPVATEIFGKEVHVHSGFYDRYTRLRPIVNDFCANLDGRKKVTFVGHSLGAAMAVMTAFDLDTISLGLKTKCVTFGMPKFSCERFHHIYSNSKIGVISVKKEHDPICHPSFVPLTCYKYIGTDLLISQNDDIWIRIMMAILLSYPLLPFSNFVLTYLHVIMVALYGMKLTHSTRTYVDTVDQFVASNHPPQLRKSLFKTPSSKPHPQHNQFSDLSSVDRIKRTVQDVALLIPILLISSISLVQFIIFSCAAQLHKAILCFNLFQPTLITRHK